MTGDLNVTWIHGAPDCSLSDDPPIQVHRFDQNTFILRQSKCSEPGTPADPGPSFEAPFLYLLIGRSRALLVDTGASRSPVVFPLAATVQELLSSHAAASGGVTVPLLVVHTHAHGDHRAGDGQFAGMPGTVVVPPGFAQIAETLDLVSAPDGTAALDLGGRILDVMPIPGHHPSHVAFYDRETQILLTGDTLYPGLLVLNDWNAYAASIARLVSFADAHPVSFLLGGHIEMTDQPGHWFGLGALFQPGEHVLELELRHLQELHEALQAMGSHAMTERHADFIIYPAGNDLPSLSP
jgi:hydroxyacylglutathione hydrolase